MKVHRLRVGPINFEAISSGKKSFEILKNDRKLEVGDIIEFFEWDNMTEDITGANIFVQITYLLEEGKSRLEKEFCALSFKILTPEDIKRLEEKV